MPEQPEGDRSVLSEDVIEAVRLGQKRCAATRSVPEQQRIEFALDELVRNPEATGDPRALLDSALAHARTKIRRRAAIVPFYPVAEPPDVSADLGGPAEQSLIDVFDVVASAPLTGPDRALLLFALADLDAPATAARLGLSVTQAQQRLSRARRHARDCGLRSLVAA
jgi:hypothetical protein